MSAFAIPDFALVCLIGPSGAGKSTLAAAHFLDTEVVSSDRCRARVADDETAMDANEEAFELLQATVAIRLRRRRLTVVDATSVRREDRASLVALARLHHALPVALVLDVDPRLCAERNANRAGRPDGEGVPRRHSQALRRGLKGLGKEGFRAVRVLRTPEDIAALEIVREPLYTDQRDAHGPFDIVGDVHGCLEELAELLERLGYRIEPYVPFDAGAEAGGERPIVARHPEGRQVIFVGDIADRGPRNVDCWRLVMGMCEAGSARAVVGNHDYKLNGWLRGRKVTLAHGLDLTVAELERASAGFRERLSAFVYDLRSHLWLDGGALVVAHAGLKAEMHGRGSAAVRAFAMYGETNGEVDEFGLPVRLDWAREYRGEAAVVYGHVPAPDAEWLGDTLCVDTGCVFGNRLTALRWPEREIVSVAAREQYAVPARSLESARGPTARADHERLLYFDDYARRLRIETRLGHAVTVPEENVLAALEATSRFALDPRWLIYLPPTMAAPPTAPEGPCLEHPEQALGFYTKRGVTDLVVEEKHMGSRALLVVCRDAAAAHARFGTDEGRVGTVYSRRGRAFFDDAALEAALVGRVGEAIGRAGLWEELGTDWLLLDAELMPWSAKAQGLLDVQYLPTAAGAEASAEALLASLDAVRPESLEGADEALATLRADALARRDNARAMRRTIAGYCHDVHGIDDYRLAPFHLLAAEGRVFTDRPHAWHMETIARIASDDPVLQPTGWRAVDAGEADAREAVTEWWTAHTEAGGEGLVIKPARFTVHGSKGLVQPAVKVRGRDYLRLIYGPDYDLADNLERLRERATGRKASLAEREFRLGHEGLCRFVERRPLREVHECVLGVLALESEAVDPRL